MPINKYYKGKGEEVMSSMEKKYGKRAKEVFYATAKKKGLEPSDKVKKKHNIK